jgi:Glycosyl transferases group 1
MNMNRCIVFLCSDKELNRERKGYNSAFTRMEIKTICLTDSKLNICDAIDQLVADLYNPLLIIHPEAHPWIPQQINKVKIPTACFAIDTFAGLRKRIKCSKLFDYAFVFHPGFDNKFKTNGHPNAICLPHAVEFDLFNGAELDRIYEVGWVGTLKSRGYDRRRKIIENLNSRFQMNDIYRYYNCHEMSGIYRQSKIAVNISRDDYQEDANLRCFEVMAGGALLITQKPTELEKLGFLEGTHYVAYTNKNEIPALIQFYLDNEDRRFSISKAARELVLDQHTYDNRAKTIIELIENNNNRLFAPARNWSEVQVHETYFYYFAKHLLIDDALRELKFISQLSSFVAWKNCPLLIKSMIRSLQLSL